MGVARQLSYGIYDLAVTCRRHYFFGRGSLTIRDELPFLQGHVSEGLRRYV